MKRVEEEEARAFASALARALGTWVVAADDDDDAGAAANDPRREVASDMTASCSALGYEEEEAMGGYG